MSLEEKVLLLVREKGEASAEDIAFEIDVPVEKVVEILKGMKSIGLLIEADTSKASDR
ncbi:MAG: hypothetical protein HY930_06560 [Euryarchaeota archaeon]|nr:hypothetical protein [Euryarchaeota archaeon]